MLSVARASSLMSRGMRQSAYRHGILGGRPKNVAMLLSSWYAAANCRLRDSNKNSGILLGVLESRWRPSAKMSVDSSPSLFHQEGPENVRPNNERINEERCTDSSLRVLNQITGDFHAQAILSDH